MVQQTSDEWSYYSTIRVYAQRQLQHNIGYMYDICTCTYVRKVSLLITFIIQCRRSGNTFYLLCIKSQLTSATYLLSHPIPSRPHTQFPTHVSSCFTRIIVGRLSCNFIPCGISCRSAHHPQPPRFQVINWLRSRQFFIHCQLDNSNSCSHSTNNKQPSSPLVLYSGHSTHQQEPTSQ